MNRFTIPGAMIATSISKPMTPKIDRLVLKRSYKVMPRTMPCCDSDFPAPNHTARGPAIAKNPTVAMKVTKIELRAMGTGTPARFMTHTDMGAEPDWKGVR